MDGKAVTVDTRLMGRDRVMAGPAKLGVCWGVGRSRFWLPPAELQDTKGSCWGWGLWLWLGGWGRGMIETQSETERAGEAEGRGNT